MKRIVYPCLLLVCGLVGCGEITDVGNPEVPSLSEISNPVTLDYVGEYVFADVKADTAGAADAASPGECLHDTTEAPRIDMVDHQFYLTHVFGYAELPSSMMVTVAGATLSFDTQQGNTQLRCTGRLVESYLSLQCELTRAGSAATCQVLLQKI